MTAKPLQNFLILIVLCSILTIQISGNPTDEEKQLAKEIDHRILQLIILRHLRTDTISGVSNKCLISNFKFN